MKTGLLIAVLLGVGAEAFQVSLDSAAHWFTVSMTDLNRFIFLTNATIEFVNERPDVDGEVPLLPQIQGGVGLAIGESFGDGIYFGGRIALVRVETATSGTWRKDNTDYQVSLALRWGFIAGELVLSFSLAQGLVEIFLAGGFAQASLHYQGHFSLPPGDWAIPFQPPTGDAIYRAAGPVGEAGAHVLFPLQHGLALGMEVGVRFAPLGVAKHGEVSLDLDGDGTGDRLDFTGLWLGFVVGISFKI